MELSIQIKKYRTELHLSQEELAEKVYVTRKTISNWENEKSYPDIHSLLHIPFLPIPPVIDEAQFGIFLSVYSAPYNFLPSQVICSLDLSQE